jgi:tRNA(adenine34) deaminase
MVPDSPGADSAAISRQARDFWTREWTGQTLMAVGAQDPVFGPTAMRSLQQVIRGCPEPVVLQQAGHFLPEEGAEIAQLAVGYFRR